MFRKNTHYKQKAMINRAPEAIYLNTRFNINIFTFSIPNLKLKQGRPGYKPELVKFKAYPDERLCVCHYLKQYLQRTATLRGNVQQLFITANPIKRFHRQLLPGGLSVYWTALE